MKHARHDTFDIDVAGGTLRVGRWSTGDHPILLAAHGITATHMAWGPIGQELARDFTVIATDLRGRGRSNNITGPFSMRRHADDLAAVLDHLGVDEPVVLAGHSMGGFVAVAMAHAHADRLSHVALLDGGPSLPMPPDTDIDVILDAVLGPAIARLKMTFASEGEYLDFWRQHPAFAEGWSPAVEDYIRYDIDGEVPALRSSASIDAVRADATDQLLGDPPSLKLPVPATMVRAPRGIMNEAGGLYPLETLASMLAGTGIEVTTLDDCNHYTMVFDPAPVAAICDHLRAVSTL